MALSQGLIDTYWRRYNQRRALTGLPSSYQEQRGILDSMMESTANKDIREAELRYNNERSNRQLSLQEQQAKDSKRAANISGATNLVGLGMQGYLGYKYLNKPAATPAPTTPSVTATGTNPAGSSYLTANDAPPPPVDTGAGSGGEGILSGAGSGTAPAASTSSYAPMTDAQMAYDTGGTPGGYGGEGAGSGGSTSSAVGGAVVGAAANIGARYLLSTGEGKKSNSRVADWSRYAGMSNLSDEQYAEKGADTVGGIAGGAYTGGPIGAAWGAAIGATVYDVKNAFQTGKISNELLGMPYADKIFNTDISSIFGW